MQAAAPSLDLSGQGLTEQILFEVRSSAYILRAMPVSATACTPAGNQLLRHHFHLPLHVTSCFTHSWPCCVV